MTLRKRHFFVIEKYVEDVKQGQKDVLDLVESIMEPTDPVKEELRRKTMKMSQFRARDWMSRGSDLCVFLNGVALWFSLWIHLRKA